MPPGWSSWHTILNSDTNHYAYGYMMNNNGVVEGPYGDSGSWETREYGEIDDAGCPYAPLNGKPCYYETDMFNGLAIGELAATPPEQPFYMQVDYTSPHGDFRKPAGPQPATRDYRPLRRGAAARQPRRRLQRGQRQRQAPLHPRSALPERRPKSTPTGSTTRTA